MPLWPDALAGAALRVDGQVLSNVGEASILGVKAPHADHRIVALPLRMVRPPRMVHVHSSDATAKVECVQHGGKFRDAQALEGCGHGGSTN